MPTATAQQTTVFVSPCGNLRLTWKQPDFEKRDINDRVIREGKRGVAVEFEGGRAEIRGETVTEERTDRRPLLDQANRVVLDPETGAPVYNEEPVEVEVSRTYVNEHMLEDVDSEELLAWLRKHWLFNRPGNNGFWEEGASPDEPKPTTSDQMTAISRAAAMRDVGAVRKVLLTEEETHNRLPILNSARDTIAMLEEMEDKPDAPPD
jgi:hypothetical protein